MAGSYSHVTTDNGNLRSNKSFLQMIDNLGDAYETVEEMYGMIWWLVRDDLHAIELVDQARQSYADGLGHARRILR